MVHFTVYQCVSEELKGFIFYPFLICILTMCMYVAFIFILIFLLKKTPCLRSEQRVSFVWLLHYNCWGSPVILTQYQEHLRWATRSFFWPTEIATFIYTFLFVCCLKWCSTVSNIQLSRCAFKDFWLLDSVPFCSNLWIASFGCENHSVICTDCMWL